MNVSFERKEQKDEWLTPPHVLSQLGEFDLDPCSPINRPWDTVIKQSIGLISAQSTVTP